MDLYEIVLKLNGAIMPVGSSEIDSERFKNLETLCDLVDKLLTDIDNVAYYCQDAPEFSKKKASEYASKFYAKIGIVE